MTIAFVGGEPALLDAGEAYANELLLHLQGRLLDGNFWMYIIATTVTKVVTGLFVCAAILHRDLSGVVEYFARRPNFRAFQTLKDMRCPLCTASLKSIFHTTLQSKSDGCPLVTNMSCCKCQTLLEGGS